MNTKTPETDAFLERHRQHNEDEMEYTLRPSPDMNTLYAPTLRTARRAKGRVAQNQRQRRKDRRRSWAAGNCKAFIG